MVNTELKTTPFEIAEEEEGGGFGSEAWSLTLRAVGLRSEVRRNGAFGVWRRRREGRGLWRSGIEVGEEEKEGKEVPPFLR